MGEGGRRVRDGGPARGVTTTGLRYPLQDGELPAWSARGVSNLVDEPPVRVDVRDGCLLVVVPAPHKD